jgi:PAS domain S-box-containing protein
MPRPINVLLLEDCLDDARLVLHALRQAGFEPASERVDTEGDFLAHLDPAPDLIVADYRLPQFDALRALRLVRERGLDVPVIVITGVLGDEAVVECLTEGACDYLLKDRLARLGQAVTRALDLKEARQENRRATEALRESEARKTAIMANAIDGIVSIDERGLIESLNPAAERFFGYSEVEVLERHVGMLMPSLFKDEHECPRNGDPTDRRETLTSTNRETTGRKKDGTTFPIEVSVSEVRLRDRRIFTGIVRDITERKRIELEMAGRARELARSNVELEQFAYVSSHDLQEPLRMIGSFTQLLARRYRGRLDDSADEFIDYIVGGVARMQSMINDLLAYCRVGNQGESFGPIEVDGVVDRALANLKSSIDETGTVVTRDPLPSIWADGNLMVKVFQNLIGNAIKYHGEDSPRIHVTAERRDDSWVFSISDNGVGFDPKHAERIFIIFQRLHEQNEYPGTGIGLAICKKIVECHGGRIWAESEPGRGARFRFTIPARANDHI